MTAYISNKSQQLTEVLRSFMQEDADVGSDVPPPTHLTKTCAEIVLSLVSRANIAVVKASI